MTHRIEVVYENDGVRIKATAETNSGHEAHTLAELLAFASAVRSVTVYSLEPQRVRRLEHMRPAPHVTDKGGAKTPCEHLDQHGFHPITKICIKCGMSMREAYQAGAIKKDDEFLGMYGSAEEKLCLGEPATDTKPETGLSA